LGAILQWSVGKHPQGIHLGNSHNHAHILDEGVSSLSFRLEEVQQVDPYEYICELLGFQMGAPEQVYVHEGTLEGF
jgi:hypothetical protein